MVRQSETGMVVMVVHYFNAQEILVPCGEKGNTESRSSALWIFSRCAYAVQQRVCASSKPSMTVF